MKLDSKKILIIAIIVALAIGIYVYLNNSKEELKPFVAIENKITSIKQGDTYKLIVSVENYPGAKVEWKSSDENIISINDGVLSANDIGSVRITASYKHTDDVFYEDSFLLTVVNDHNEVELLSISILEGDIIMGVNNTFDINSIITKEPIDGTINTVNYYISNKSILTISDDGIIKCNNSGSSSIMVEYNGVFNESKDVYCIDDNIKSGLIINPKSISVLDEKIKIGETKSINYTITPSNASSEYLSFSSLDSDVVCVDNNGIITGLKEGTGVIKISSINGVNTSMEVVVEKDIILVEAINLSNNTLSMTAGEKGSVEVTISPDNATNKTLYVSSSDESVAVGYMDNNKLNVIANKAGTAIISVKNKDNVTNQVNVTVKAKPSSNTGNATRTPPIPVVITEPTITSTGTINDSLLSSATNEGFNSCKSLSPNLTLKANGKTIGQDGSVTMKVGQSIAVDVYLPTKCGEILTLTRTTADGGDGWGTYVFQSNDPSVNRYNSSTFVKGVKKYKWTITALSKGSVILSQTAQFDVKAPNGTTGNIKSMIRFHVKIV